MNEALQITVAGLGGVFAGMTLLYIAIRITSALTDWMSARSTDDG